MISSTAPLVELFGVTVRFGEFVALDAVSANFGRPGVTGLIGANGAGKTTMIHAVLGLQLVAAGSIQRHGSGIAFCPDTPRFERFLTATEVLSQSAALSGASLGASPRKYLRQVGLEHAATRRTGGFSRGMLQRLGVAAALVAEPSMLILDEPTSALDPAGREEMIHLIEQLGAEMPVVFSSHILSDVERVADHIIVVDRGTVPFDGELDDLLALNQTDHFEIRLADDEGELREALEHADIRLDDIGNETYRIDRSLLRPTLRVLSRFEGELRRLDASGGTLQHAYDALVARAAR